LIDRMGGTYSSAFAINGHGQIAGSLQSQTGKRFPHAALFNAETNGADLGTLGGDMSIGIDINQNGQIVGWAENSQINNRAFLYDNGVMQDLGTLGGQSSEAYALNDSGVIVGTADTQNLSSTQHAFIYSHAQMVDIHALSPFLARSLDSEARDINDSEQVVGFAYFPVAEPTGTGARAQGYLYDHGVAIGLGTLGGDYSTAYAINNRSQVVGHSKTASGSTHAYLYDEGVMTDLNSLISPTLGWELLFAQDINDSGQIVGYGLIGGQGHAFLLTPVPEPRTLSLIILAACVAVTAFRPLSMRRMVRRT
jgi:probable HAF family extracellular repeat protein